MGSDTRLGSFWLSQALNSPQVQNRSKAARSHAPRPPHPTRCRLRLAALAAGSPSALHSSGCFTPMVSSLCSSSAEVSCRTRYSAAE